MPTDRGRQMDMSAWGLKPSLYFIGVPARRKMRCTTRMRSRCEIYTAFPVFWNLNLSLSIASALLQQRRGPAGRAGRAAVRRELRLVGPVPLTQQQALPHTHIHAAPGQHLILPALARGVKGRVEAAVLKCPHPALEAEIVAPGLHAPAGAPDGLDDVGYLPVAAREGRLDKAGVRVVPVVADVLRRDAAAEQLHAAAVFLHRHLRLPLEGAVRLGDEAGRADGYPHAALLIGRILPPDVQHLRGKVGDAAHVLIRLRGQAEHEIELDSVPAALEGYAAGVQQVVFRYVLVYDVAQALRPGLGREGQAAAPYLLQAAHELHGEVVRAQGGQREADILRLKTAHNFDKYDISA